MGSSPAGPNWEKNFHPTLRELTYYYSRILEEILSTITGTHNSTSSKRECYKILKCGSGVESQSSSMWESRNVLALSTPYLRGALLPTELVAGYGKYGEGSGDSIN